MKLLRQVLIFFIEMLTVTTMIVWGINGELNFELDLLELLRQYVFAYTLYQLILITVYKLKDSFEIDAITAMRNEVDKLQLYAEFKLKVPGEKLESIQSKLIDNKKVVLNKKHRKALGDIVSLTHMYNSEQVSTENYRFSLKQESRELDFNTKIMNFYWMNSILLRWFK